MFGKRPSKAARSKAARSKTARLGFESLESRIVMSGAGYETDLTNAVQSAPMDVASVETTAFSQPAALLAVEEWVQSLQYWQFNQLQPGQVQYQTLEQVASIPSASYLAQIATASRNALSVTQIRALNISNVGISVLTPTQIGYVTAAQIQQVKSYELDRLGPAQIPYVTAAQLSGIASAGMLAEWSAASRGALSAAQIRALNISNVGVSVLTPTQIGYFSAAQIQQVKSYELNRLSPAQIPYVTAVQVSGISSAGMLAQWSSAARAALSAAQVKSLNISNVGISLLTATQVGYLSAAQIQQVKYYELDRLSPAQIPYVAASQLSSISSAGMLAEWSPAARAALSAAQVKSLNISDVGVSLLTATQVGYLSAAQIQQVKYYELDRLGAAQIPYVTAAQLSSISTAGMLAEWSSASLGALSSAQVKALNVAKVRINSLPPEQISFLSVPQIQSLGFVDFDYLWPSQIPYITASQLRSMPNSGVLAQLSDAAQAALTREQILSMPADYIAYYTRVEPEQYPPSQYVPVVDRREAPGGHAQEAMKFYNLVPLAGATHATVASGNWSDPKIWRNGVVPTAGAKVAIAAGTTVRMDVVMTAAIDTLRIDGTLSFATDRNTKLYADTVVVTDSGKLHVGTAASPIQDNVTARIQIADGGPIDRRWDPYGLSRGVMSGGEVRMFGKNVTSYVALAADPMAGDTTLRLASIPTNWKVGDQLVITGVDPYTTDFGTETVTIRAINGSTVAVDRLKYNHNAPDGQGLSIYVANQSRNIILEADNPTIVAQRPHMVFFQSPNVQIENISVSGFGRTDKSKPINDPVVINGVLQPGTGTNPRARYALHFHHTGVDPLVAAARVSGSIVLDSPGWGFVNHQSNVDFVANVAFNVRGSSFVTEDGNEIGSFDRNLSINSLGATWESMQDRRANHDFGYNGHGFWMQGPGVELTGNIAAGSRLSGFVYFTSSSKSLFDAVNLDDPSMAGNQKAVPVGSVPWKKFANNVSYAAQIGLDVWFHQHMMTDGESVVDNFASWGSIHGGIMLRYAGNITIANSKLLGDLEEFKGAGVSTNSFVHDVTINNLTAIGFEVGVDVPVRRATVVNGAMIAAVQAFQIEKGYDTIRSVAILGQVSISNPTALQLRGRTHWKVYLYEDFDFQNSVGRRLDSYTSADQITWAPYGIAVSELYFYEQASGFTPFPAATAAGIVPNGYLNLNNFQLAQNFGVSFAGQLVPAGSVSVAGIRGYVGPLDI